VVYVIRVTAAGRPLVRLGCIADAPTGRSALRALAMFARAVMWMFLVMLGVAFIMESPTPLAIAP
jgi:hypothetical protein